MNVQKIYDILAQRLVEIELHKSIIGDLVREELIRLSRHGKEISDAGDDPDSIFGLSMQSMLFQTLRTGDLIRYGFVETDVQGQARRTAEHKNRQYGWLLVEAYEEFEDFLERIYAHIGKTDRNAWHLEDFGRAKLPDLESNPYEWYLKAVRQKYGQRPLKILTRLRQLYPELKFAEESNIYNVHIRVAIELIASLRHRIVHARGRIYDPAEFVGCVLEKCGLWNNGNPNQGLKDFILEYVIEDSDAHSVWLYERRAAPSNVPLDVYHDMWNQLITYLISYAHSICTQVDPEFDADNQQER